MISLKLMKNKNLECGCELDIGDLIIWDDDDNIWD